MIYYVFKCIIISLKPREMDISYTTAVISQTNFMF